MRNITFENGEYYHIYNRGADKRDIFDDEDDIWRFIKGMLIFNREKPSGSIRDDLDIDHHNNNLGKDPVLAQVVQTNVVDYAKLIEMSNGLVEIVCFCLNHNHYHLLVRQISDNGVSKFIHRLGSGYTTYYNIKNIRSGVLFQGKFKAVHIESNEQLLYTSAYVNLNDKIHSISADKKHIVFSSWNEYLGRNKKFQICKSKYVVLEQFKNFDGYKKFAESVAETARDLKDQKREDSKNHLE